MVKLTKTFIKAQAFVTISGSDCSPLLMVDPMGMTIALA